MSQFVSRQIRDMIVEAGGYVTNDQFDELAYPIPFFTSGMHFVGIGVGPRAYKMNSDKLALAQAIKDGLVEKVDNNGYRAVNDVPKMAG